MSDHANHDKTRREKLDEVIGAFLVALDSGQKPNPAEWLAQYPDLCPELAEFFADRERVDALVEPLMVAAPEQVAEPTVSIAADRSYSSGSSPQTAPGSTEGARGDAMAPDDDGASIALPRGTRVRYFGDYELQKILGEGGMGVVYKARQISLNRPVALKMIKAARFASDDDLRRFQNEAEAVARLDHPNIVPNFEVGRFEDQHYFSMKLIGGESLDKRLKKYGADPRRAARLVAVVAGAIHHAHQRGILHRDLKPANILIDPDGQPHVTDFGLAKRVEGDGELTQSGAILGTPAYMAPEQASGTRGVVTTSTDVHGLGAILFALLTGRAPFGGATVLDTLEQVRERAPDSPRKLNPRVPRDLDVICLKCLEKDPRRRYASADALAEDLNRWVAGEPIAARRVSNAARVWMWCRRNPVAAIAAGLVAASLVAVAVLSLLYASQQTRLATARKLYADEQTHRADEQAAAAAKISGSLADTNRRLAMLFFGRAQGSFENDQIGVGVLWLVESWRFAVKAGDPSWQHLARANLSLWRYNCHELKGVLSHGGGVDRAIFSPDGKLVLSTSDDRTARLWDAATAQPTSQPMVHEGGIGSAAFSPDGKTILTSSGTTVRLWDARANPVGQPMVHQGPVSKVAFSPDGKIILTSTWDKTARLWNAVDGRPIGQPLDHAKQSTAVQSVVSPDGRIILTGGQDKTARLWDAATAKPIGQPMVHRDTVSSVAFSPDGKTILTGGLDKTARLWDAVTTKSIGPPLVHQDAVWSVAFSPDGRTPLTVSGKTVRLWDIVTCLPIGPPMVHQGPDLVAVYSPDGKIVLTGNADKTARLWDAATAMPIGPPIVHQDRVSKVAFSPDGRRILTCSGRTARLWDISSNPIGHPLKHQGPVSAMAFSLDGRMILTGSGDRTARVWDAATGLPIGPPLEHRGVVIAVAFSPDRKTILTGGTDKTARMWDIATAKPIGPPLVHQGRVSKVEFSRDGKTFFTNSQFPRETRVWHTPAHVDDDLPRVQTWVETITGLQADEQGNVHSLDPRAWQERRERLRQLGGPPKSDSGWLFDPALYGAEPNARAQAFSRQKRWAEAEKAFNEAIATRPYNTEILVARSGFRILRALARSQFEAAQAEIDLAVTLRPDELWPRYRQILSLLASNDRNGVIQARASLLDRFGQVTDMWDAENVAGRCSLVPEVNDRVDVVVRLSERAMENRSVGKADYLDTLGAALFRAGRFEDAAQRLKEGIQLRDGRGVPKDWVFLAMAHHRLGHPEEARRLLDRLRNHEPSTDPNKFWDELEIRLLRSEAEAVILYDPVFPADPFAH